MELDLKKDALAFYEFGTAITAVHEESTETIVPDYCPDIARIIDSSGKVFLRSRDIQGEKAIVTGSIKVTVLFTPEGENGIRSLEFSMPFSTSLSNQDFERCRCLFAGVQIQSMETKSLNPRKIFTRVLLTVRLRGLKQAGASFCSSIAAEPALGIAELIQEEDLQLMTAYAEKDFSFTDEMSIGSGKDPVAEVLSAGMTPNIQETKIFGNKLIIKGVLLTELLYRSEQQEISSASAELPFSQIVEVEDGNEDAVPVVQLQLAGLEHHIGSDENPDDRHRITVTVYLSAQVYLRREVKYQYISDVYSTAYELVPTLESFQCTGKTETISQKQDVRQVIEVGVIPSKVLFSSLVMDEVNISREDDTALLQAMAHIKLLFLDEGDVPLVAERQIECTGRMAVSPDDSCSALANYMGDLVTVISSAGIEVHFTVEFTMESTERKQLLGLTHLTADEEHPKDIGSLPSIVLKLMDESESLWSIAKRYSTTVEVIRAANEMEDNAVCRAGQMILIPRKR